MSHNIVDFAAYYLPAAYNPRWNGELVRDNEPGLLYRGPVRVFDFANYPSDEGRLSECIFWFAHSLEQWWVNVTLGTAHERFHALKHFFTYLARYEPSVTSTTDISEIIMDRFAYWIRHQRGWGAVLQRRVFTVPSMLIRQMRNVRPSLIRADYRTFRFSAPRNLNHPNYRSTKETLSRKQIRQILLACNAEIKRHYELWCSSRAAMDRARDAGYKATSIPNWADLGQLLVWLEAAYLARKHAKREISDLLYKHVVAPKLHGFSSYADVYRCFLIDHHCLVPYIVSISAYTAANTTSLLAFDIDCLDAPEALAQDPNVREIVHVLTGDRERVYWDKKRSGYVQYRSFKTGEELLPPDLIKKINQMTRPLRGLVDKRFRKMLFIHDCLRKKVLWIRQDTWSNSLNVFRKQHRLPYFTIGALRNAQGEHAYVHSGGDLLGTQRILNHRSSDTTHNVYLRGLARRKNDTILGRLSILLVKWGLSKKTEPAAPTIPAQSLGAGEKRITDWMELLGNPYVILRTSSERIARILQLKQHLGESKARLHPIRWQSICAPLFKVLEYEVMPRFTARELELAQPLIEALPPFPRIE